MKIQYNTTAEGVLEQEGNQVLYQRIRFTIEQLCSIVYRLVEETYYYINSDPALGLCYEPIEIC